MSKRRNERGLIAKRPPSAIAARARRWLSPEDGNSIIEIALTLPILLTVMTAIWQFGIVYNQMISLTQATTQGAQVLQTDRMSSSGDPCADTFSAIKGFAPTLNSAKIVLTITINGTTYTKTSCSGATLAMGQTVSVQTSYPYTLGIVGIKVATGSMNTGVISETEY